MEKRGAIELSISTIVVIVIAMSMLVLGLVLVRSIFTGSTQSVDALNEGVMNEIVNLFDDASGNLAVKLGSENLAKIKPGERFNVAIGAQHPDGASVTRDTLLYRLELDTGSNDNCVRVLGETRAKSLFSTPLDTWNSFDRFSGSNSFALIEIDVPTGTERCTQKVNIDTRISDSTTPFAGDFFLLEIDKPGIF